MPTGKVYLVGAGPGDPGLLTLKGKRCLEQADVVIYDYLVDIRLLDYVRPEATLLYAGKRGGGRAVPRQTITALMREHAANGKVVTRLKGGDPLLFGRGGEEAEELVAANIPFEIIPGVSSATAAPAYAGIPLTHRDHASAVTIVSGHKEVWETAPHLNWATLAGVGSTLVFLMGPPQLQNNMQRLMEFGLPAETPIALIRGGTKADQDVLTGTVGSIAERAAARAFEPPAVVVVGDVVRLRDRLRWFESQPLFGKRIVITRPRTQASRFADLLEQHGAEVFRFPLIETAPMDSSAALDAALDDLARYDWLVFTSVNGVRYFFERVQARQRDIRSLGGIRIAAIGPETARSIQARHLRVDAMPGEYRAEALIPVLKAEKAQRILLPRAAEARAILPQELRASGTQVDEIAIYRTIRPRNRDETLRDMLRAGQIDMLTFTSSSTVRNFMACLAGEESAALLGHARIGCIGPITAATAQEYGLTVAVQPSAYTIPAFVEAIVAYFRTANDMMTR